MKCIAIAFGLLVAFFSSGAGPEKPARYSTNAVERQECERQLNIIFGAIENYREQHDNQYPARLSDLSPDFIHDAKMLVCPFVRTRGGLRPWKAESRELGPDDISSYSYELAPEPLPYNVWRGAPQKTWRDLKLAAAKEVGPVVPVVRCHLHRPRLNLGMDGKIYPSGMNWEENFRTNTVLMSMALLSKPPPRRPLTAADFPPRDPHAESQLLDLTDFYNATLTNSWQGFPGNHLGRLPSGVQTLDGVRFDIRGVIQLYGEDLPVAFPKQVDGIRVEQKCRRLHFLHAVSLRFGPGRTDGFYVVHYADGQVQEVPLFHAQQIDDWWRDSKSPARPTEAKEVWTGTNEATEAHGQILSLHRFTWSNLRADIPVSTITFASSTNFHAPFVVAITVE